MTKLVLTAAALTLTAAPALADDHMGGRGYALAEGGATLVTMADLSMPGTVQTVALSQPLRAIAWRPVTGDLLGFADGAIVSIDPASGATTDLGASFADGAMIGADAPVAFDFNNAIDAVRAVGADGANLV